MNYRDLFPHAVDAPRFPAPGDAGFNPCHADGTRSTGYDPTQQACHTLCADKFTCLPRKLLKGRSKQREVDIDTEVAALRDGRITYARAVARMRRRLAILNANDIVPDDLLPTAPIARELHARDDAPTLLDALPRLPELAPGIDVRRTHEPTTRRRKRVATPEEPRRGKKGAVYTADRLPKPATLTPYRLAQMLEELSDKLGLPVGRSLKVGHVIVKRRQGRQGVEVTVVEDGFRLNLDGQVYASLSSCACVAERRNQGLTAYFSMLLNRNVEVHDQHGGVIGAPRRSR